MISLAERTELLAHVARRDGGRLAHDVRVALAETAGPRGFGCRRCVAMRALADRDHLLDRGAYAAQIAREIFGTEGELRGDHAATDVDADRSRNDRTDRRDHAADRRALADVYIRHHRDVAVDEREQRHVLDLTARAGVELDAANPGLDRTSGGFEDFHGGDLLSR